MSYSIYLITNLLNSKVYVGLSKNPEKRWIGHQRIANMKSSKQKQRLHAAISKYGVHNFTFEIIEHGILSIDLAFERERHWISEYKSYTNSELGYNMTPGGEGGPTFLGRKHTNEFKEKMSMIQKNRSFEWKANFKAAHQNRSEQWRKNMSIAQQNRQPIKDETRMRMREAWIKRIAEGRVITDDGRKRISEKLMGHVCNENTRSAVSDTRKLQLLKQDIAILEGKENVSQRAKKRHDVRVATGYWFSYEFKQPRNKAEAQDLLTKLKNIVQGLTRP